VDLAEGKGLGHEEVVAEGALLLLAGSVGKVAQVTVGAAMRVIFAAVSLLVRAATAFAVALVDVAFGVSGGALAGSAVGRASVDSTATADSGSRGGGTTSAALAAATSRLSRGEGNDNGSKSNHGESVHDG